MAILSIIRNIFEKEKKKKIIDIITPPQQLPSKLAIDYEEKPVVTTETKGGVTTVTTTKSGGGVIVTGGSYKGGDYSKSQQIVTEALAQPETTGGYVPEYIPIQAKSFLLFKKDILLEHGILLLEQ